MCIRDSSKPIQSKSTCVQQSFGESCCSLFWKQLVMFTGCMFSCVGLGLLGRHRPTQENLKSWRAITGANTEKVKFPCDCCAAIHLWGISVQQSYGNLSLRQVSLWLLHSNIPHMHFVCNSHREIVFPVFGNRYIFVTVSWFTGFVWAFWEGTGQHRKTWNHEEL